jgi:hypothetical protein
MRNRVELGPVSGRNPIVDGLSTSRTETILKSPDTRSTLSFDQDPLYQLWH